MGAGERHGDEPGLTEKQVAARKRLRYQTQQIIAAGAKHNDLSSALGEKKASAEASITQEFGISEAASIPDGPPWKYDLSPEERARKEEKRARRAQKTESIKAAALKKTPSKLKHPTDLQVRFRTALVYTLVTIACIFAGDIAFLLYLMVVAGFCAGEFYYMLRSDAKLPNEALGITGAVAYLPAMYLWGLTGCMVVALILLIALLVWYVFWLRARIADVGISYFGAAYTGLLLCGLLVIRQSVEGIWGSIAIFILFLSVWGNDAFAYFVGSRFGKHKMAPRTSPKKSWEGFFAGLVASVLGWVILTFIPGISLAIPLAVVFGILCGFAQTIGDLAESRIKRNSGFKDSGTIMPGHGGMLDRCDSLFLASVTSAVFLVVAGAVPFNLF